MKDIYHEECVSEPGSASAPPPSVEQILAKFRSALGSNISSKHGRGSPATSFDSFDPYSARIRTAHRPRGRGRASKPAHQVRKLAQANWVQRALDDQKGGHPLGNSDGFFPGIHRTGVYGVAPPAVSSRAQPDIEPSKDNGVVLTVDEFDIAILNVLPSADPDELSLLHTVFGEEGGVNYQLFLAALQEQMSVARPAIAQSLFDELAGRDSNELVLLRFPRAPVGFAAFFGRDAVISREEWMDFHDTVCSALNEGGDVAFECQLRRAWGLQVEIAPTVVPSSGRRVYHKGSTSSIDFSHKPPPPVVSTRRGYYKGQTSTGFRLG